MGAGGSVGGGGGGGVATAAGDAINAMFRQASRPPIKGVAILMPLACNARACLSMPKQEPS